MSNDNVKTYYFPDGNGSGNQNGLDSNLLWGMMMGNGGFGGFGGGNWLLALLFFALWGNNGWANGFGGGRGNMDYGFLSNQLNNETGRDLLMQAIQGNANAINQLSSMLNCNAGELRNAISSINTQICNLGSQVGMSSMQIINAINAGDANLASQLASCCCDIKQAIGGVNVGLERGFSSVAYETQRQTCDIEKAIASSTEQILAGQRAAELREMQEKLDVLREKNAQQAVILNNAQQTAQFGAMLAPIQADLAELKCNQPTVKKICCPEQYVPIDQSIRASYGLIPNGYCGFGGFPFGGFYNGFNNAF